MNNTHFTSFELIKSKLTENCIKLKLSSYYHTIVMRSVMKLICTWCWLRIYCLTTVKSKDYQKFEWYWDVAWW